MSNPARLFGPHRPTLPVRSTLALLLGACLTLVSPGLARSLPDGSSGAPADEWVWISLGTDAWEVAARHSPGFGRGPLPRIEERHGLVISRLRKVELDGLSSLLHREVARCPGFMAHPSLDEARQAVAAAVAIHDRGAGIDFRIDQPARVDGLVSMLNPVSLLDTIDHLSNAFTNRYYLHPMGTDAATWIRDLWQGWAAGRDDVTVELYHHPGVPQPSVVLTLEGAVRPAEVVVLGGHLDSVAPGSGNPGFRAPGADDNASGIAVLGEVVRVAMISDFRPQRTVKVMAYAAEEIGLVGSQDIAGDFADAGVDVVAVLQLDMTDYHGSVQDMAFLTDFTNPTLTTFAAQLVATYQPDLLRTTTACGYGCSDHASWHREGFPAVMPSEAIFGQHNPNLHTTNDTLATLGDNVDHAMKFARLAVAFMVEIGVDDDGALFFDGFESGGPDRWSATAP